MNKVKVTVAALAFVSSATAGTFIYDTAQSGYVDGVAGQCPLVMNLSEELDKEWQEGQKIEKIIFSVDAKTNLDGEKAFLNQGQIYYYVNDEMEHRNFSDLVSVGDKDYELVKSQKSLCTQFTVGSKKKPLNADIDKDITISWTWITSEKLSMYGLQVETTDGKIHNICMNDDYYTIEIAEEMKEDKENLPTANTEFMFPLKGRYCVTSIQGWDTDRYHDALDLVPYEDDNIYSACDGVVEYADWENPWDYSQGYGQYIKVHCDDGAHDFFYGHLSEIDVEVGQRVERGQKIGVIGSTGMSTGTHLDFSINYYDEEADVASTMGVTNDYGDYEGFNGNDNKDGETILKCLAINKEFEAGHLGANAIRPNDNGALALGICQWNGSNAKKMLSYLYSEHPDVYTNIANKYNAGFVKYLDNTDEWWDSHVITENGNEYNFYTELLDNDTMIETQYNYAVDYMRTIVDDAHEHGITDDRSVMIFAKCYNVLPYGGVAEQMRNGVNKFEDVCAVLRADTNTNRHEEVIDFASKEVALVTVETLKGERE